MASVNRLSARAVSTLNRPGKHADGGNLYLAVSKTGSKSWLFIYRDGGRQREMGLGSLTRVSLAQARDLAADARGVLVGGADPIRVRRRSVAIPTFSEMAEQHIAAMEVAWRNEKHREQWRNTLKTYAHPIAAVAIDKIATHDVMRVLSPIWHTKPETASRVRGRIEAILDAARAQGFRTGENPARWRGHLDSLLPKPKKLVRGHHAAMPYDEVPAFIRRLREQDGVGARGLEFTILTAARTGEAIGARWDEISTDRSVWIVPAERMKGAREHRVPLSGRCRTILAQAADWRRDEFIFPGLKRGRPLSNMAFDMLLRRLGSSVTTHGFRSSFRDWAGEETMHSREVAEAALAHLVGDETERAYRRGDAIEKRRRLMDDWASFLEGPTHGQ